MPSESKPNNKGAPPRPLAYPYQKRPVYFEPMEDDSVAEKLLFRKVKPVDKSPQRAQTVPENMRSKPQDQTRDELNGGDLKANANLDISNAPTLESEGDFDNGLSTAGQELYIVDDSAGFNNGKFICGFSVRLIKQYLMFNHYV